MKRLTWIVFLCFSVLLSAKADIKLPAIFADDMLMQQKTTCNIWGQATPNKKVTIITGWNLKNYSTTADGNGNWKLAFSTPKAGGPYTMAISDGKVLTLKNILIGELWLCSGQSNMEMPMKGFKNQPVLNSNMDILKSANPEIRLFSVKRDASLKPQGEVSGRWEEAMPVSVKEFSATAYYFGRLLNEMLKVPVGLIVSSWGGSSIEAWMSEDMLRAFPSVKIPASGEGLNAVNRVPTMLYNAMIHPIIQTNIRGVIWYQGETNCERADSYADMFKTMVEGWRKNGGLTDTVPFYFCQIAPFDYGKSTPENKFKNSAYLREAQVNAEKITPKTGMAVLMDAGDEKNIHPANKQVAGERLALLALSKTYNMPGFAAESPVYKEMTISNDTVTLAFDRAPMWLTAPGMQSKLFMVAGSDKVFYPAKAWISRSKVVVTSDAVKQPVAVRYAFENFVVGDLFSTEGIPVSSFRTDNW